MDVSNNSIVRKGWEKGEFFCFNNSLKHVEIIEYWYFKAKNF